MSESFRRRWAFGIRFGLIAAGLASAWVTVAYVLTDGSSLASRGVSLPAVLLVYFGGAVLGSVVYGVVAPFFRSRLGAGLGGFLITFPLFVAIAISLPGEDLGHPRTWRTIALSAATLGGLVGFLSWEPE
jgi:hypothetical protein